jgi:hypothetical protein
MLVASPRFEPSPGRLGPALQTESLGGASGARRRRIILGELAESSVGDSRTAPDLNIAVSDCKTLGGLTQFATQFGFAGSATSL